MKRTSDLVTGTQTFTPDGVQELEALGPDLALLSDQFESLLIVLAKLRTKAGPLDESTIRMGLNDVVRKLGGAVEGISAALIREHHVAGLTLGHLAESMSVPLSTAQGRRERIIKGHNPASQHEVWAVRGGPRDIGSPLFTGAQSGRRVITDPAELKYIAGKAHEEAHDVTRDQIKPSVSRDIYLEHMASNFVRALLRMAAPAAVEAMTLIKAASTATTPAVSGNIAQAVLYLGAESLIGTLLIDGRTSYYSIPKG